ncbi:glycosyltransferase family 4 protein [Nodularia sphaerocarpa]|uniref:glycosyltransferase family 4 protein n=1 Tax=Nodularia sphaerocarpa TaxID=137816 RepID=UPI001EFA2C54|nr:glycosyltransferase family 4 protein [Nodularia sphaerocarpa]MDB9374997.1 glycosyltransferase family 4 protein [Nodularia sphaerocarpa CS-585]MDB9378384.1 glycosyltransferase family 4 protein [Nodularia sphaerocarpa CS-585A2]ULP74209.1 GDP-mannose-dependent alpha-(1-6)-phosphatidylinositol monomannoside mannosyltransferase [Nodularia sphaerocarpa UHCC 0038]
MKPLKIAVIVHGRFYAFDLVRELIKQGHDVTLFTNYPKYIVEKFGIPRSYVCSFLLHGILSRIFHRLTQLLPSPSLEPLLSSLFSKWVAKQISKENYDVIHCFSGIAEELFKSLSSTSQTVKTLVRGSSHIRVQKQLLEAEEIRANSLVKTPLKIDQPSDWIIEREEREYQLADIVIVLSTFAQTSFIQQGIEANKLSILPLGAQLSFFRPDAKVIADRCQRILSGQPLKVLMIGTFSLRKGAIDFIEIAKNAGAGFQFQFVGSITNEADFLYQTHQQYIDFIPRKPEAELPQFYAEADIFIFTTIEDGYAVVLSQAQAAGLPIIATTNCSAPDIIVDNETGWVLPIRSPDAFVEKLKWCNEHRPELEKMVKRVYEDFQPRDWSDVAEDFTIMVRDYLDQGYKQFHGKSL